MGDGTDPVSAASGPDSGLRAVRGEMKWELAKPAELFKPMCFNKTFMRYTVITASSTNLN